MDPGWLQRDVGRGATQRIGVRWDAFDQLGPPFGWSGIPIWFKVSVRRFDASTVEVAVQGYTDSGYGRQAIYGHATCAPQVLSPGGFELEVPLALDGDTEPEDPPGIVGWPDSPWPTQFWLSIDWCALAGAYLEVVTYGLEWWSEVLFNFTSGLKTQLDTIGWSQTVGAGHAAPDDVVLVTDDTLAMNDIRAKLKDGLVVIHGATEVPSEPAYMGGSGRKGRTYRAAISIFVRSDSGLTASDKEVALLKAAYMAEDLVDRLAPPRNPNLLGGWLYFSQLQQEGPVQRVVDAATKGTVARVDFTFTGYKIQLVTDDSVIPAGDGVSFNFNQGFLAGPVNYKWNDHSLVYVPATGLYHAIGITATPRTYHGSDYFHHHTSVDGRTWTRLADIHIGTNINLNWRAQVWAPHIFLNPVFGVGGATTAAYKWLMAFTGANYLGASQLQTSEQKIGLAGCVNDDLASWDILNSDAPIYWSKKGGVLAAWAWDYDTNWNRYTRDPAVFQDGSDWFMAVCARSSTSASRNAVGLAKFAGGATPDFLSVSHEAAAIVHSTADSNSHMESSLVVKIGTLWHLLHKGTNGTRYQNGLTKAGPPWSGSPVGGSLLMNQGGYPIEGTSYGEASELAQIGGAGSVYFLSGHLQESTTTDYFIALLEADFASVDIVGEPPTMRAMCGITGLVGLRDGVLDRTLRWSIIDSQGSAGAFFYQPVWGDQAAAAGHDPSGMTGNSYIATLFRQYCPGAGLNGQEWPDSTKVGAIQSSSFTITRNRMELWVGGGNYPTQEFVALCRADDDTILFSETGQDSHTMTRRLWDLSSLAGLDVYLVVVDNATGAFGNISVDAIREYNETDNLRDGATTPDPAGVVVTGLLP